MQLELYFAEQKTRSCCFMKINVFAHHAEFSSVFLKLINICIVAEALVFIVFSVLQLFTQEKVKLEKNHRNSLSQMFCKQVFGKIKQNSQESNCAGPSFKYSCRDPACNFFNEETQAQVFSCHNFTHVQVCSNVSHDLLNPQRQTEIFFKE